jgi:hypothetical protein
MARRSEGESLLAYLFWHWKRPEITAMDYENRQRGFHAALGTSPSPGFVESFSFRVSNAPWAAVSDAYEDWYLVQDFAALGPLNEAAVSAHRAPRHDAAAAAAAGGAGGLYGLKSGSPLRPPQYAHWFRKPEGMPYPDFYARVTPVVDRVQGALWRRQMVLGPAPEFCLHAATPVSMPAGLEPLVIPLRQTWPDVRDAVEQTR